MIDLVDTMCLAVAHSTAAATAALGLLRLDPACACTDLGGTRELPAIAPVPRSAHHPDLDE